MKALSYVGELALFIWEVLKRLPRVFSVIPYIINEVWKLGIGSLSIILITLFLGGFATAYTAATQGKGYLPEVYIGMAVAKAFFIMLGPLLTGLLLAGKVTSALAAEIGSMKVTEQIDALETLAIDPYHYIILPRIMATLIATPILTMVGEVSAMIGGGICAVTLLHVKLINYIEGLRFNFIPMEFAGSLVKSAVFGAIIGTIGTFYGMKAMGGAESVGKCATQSVVAASVLVVVFDNIVGVLMFNYPI